MSGAKNVTARNDCDEYAQDVPLTKSSLLNTVFNSGRFKPKTTLVDFCGVTLEIRQPTLRAMQEASVKAAQLKERTGNDDSDRLLVIKILLEDAYIPGTNEHLFTEAHVDQLMELPQGPEIVAINKAYTTLIGGDLGNAEKN